MYHFDTVHDGQIHVGQYKGYLVMSFREDIQPSWLFVARMHLKPFNSSAVLHTDRIIGSSSTTKIVTCLFCMGLPVFPRHPFSAQAPFYLMVYHRACSDRRRTQHTARLRRDLHPARITQDDAA